MKTLLRAYIGTAVFVTLLLVGSVIALAAPSVNILGNRAVVGTGLNATTSPNGHFTASGTVVFTSLINCNLDTDGDGTVTCGTDATGGGSGGGTTTTIAGLQPATDIFLLLEGAGLKIATTSPGTITFTNNGVLSLTSGGALTVSSATGTVTLTNNAPNNNTTTTITAGTGLTVTNQGIGATTITNNGVLSLVGTPGQVHISSATGTVTLTSPQTMWVTSTVQFGGVTSTSFTATGLTASRIVQTLADGLLSVISNLTSWIAGTSNQITVGDDGDGTVTLSLPQNIHTGANNFTIAGATTTALTISGLKSGFLSVGATGIVTTSTIVKADTNFTDVVDLASSTWLKVLNNLSDLNNVATARTNLGVAIGTNVQAWDNDLDDFAALTPTIGDIITTAGTDWTDFAVGTNGKVLTASSTATNGISWETIVASASAGGANTNIQVNEGGAIAGYSTLTYASGTQLLTTPSSTITGTLKLSSLKSGFLKVDANNVVSTSTVDISSDTNLAAGRSLTMSGDSIEADTELYTDEFSIAFINATTTQNGSVQRKTFDAITITQIDCSTNGANITIGLDERASSTPQTGGTDIFNGGSMICASANTSTSTFANATIAASALISLDVDSAANATTTLRVHVKFTRDD